MNAIETVAERPRAPSSAPHPTHKFRLLLRREFWEHKGGFLWGPVVVGGAFLLLSLVAFAPGGFDIHVGNIQVGGGQVSLQAVISQLSKEDVRGLGDMVGLGLYTAAAGPFTAMAFVVFFYCLGTLYDERKDRSVLFWKSLPLSDRETVLAKVATAALVAPGLATAVAIVTMFGFLGLVSVVVFVNGGDPVRLLWAPGKPFAAAGNLVAYVPVYAIWALPTIGWLLLCSAWAKNKPFLWATMIPVFAGVFVSLFHAIDHLQLEPAWFWKNVVSRMLLGITPHAGLQLTGGLIQSMDDEPRVVMSLANTYRVFATPQLWAGALAGMAMIYGAIRVRRWRDEGAG